MLNLRRRIDQMGLSRRLQPLCRGWGFERGQPIDRFYIERFLDRNCSDIRGRVLEFRDAYYTHKYGADRVVQSDVMNLESDVPGSTWVTDLTRADQVPSEIYDNIICTQTLQYVNDPRAAIRHLHRMLRPGGVLLVTLPVISKRIGDWNDCWWGFTSVSAAGLFGETFGSEQVRTEGHGNVLALTLYLHGLVAEEMRLRDLEYADPEYEMLITVRAVKSSGGGDARHA